MQKVAVVILNYKVADLTVKCIQSVLKSTYKSLEIIVVDNNSGDGVEEKISNFPGLIFIQTGNNLGYAGGNNIGIKKALAQNADFVLVLNPDTTVLSDTIEKLVTGLEENNGDLASPKVYFNSPKQIWFAGGKFDRANVLGSHIGVNEKDQGQYDNVKESDFLTGAAFFVKAEVFKKIGFFDERYFLYYEDSDFSFRARKAGFKLLYLPLAIVYHDNAKSTGLGTSLQDYFITRNRMLFAKKFLPFRTQVALVREAWRNRKIPARKLALKDFLMGKFGKGSFIHD